MRKDHGLVQTVSRPELDLAVVTAAGQSPVGQHRQRVYPAAMREDHGFAHTVSRPELDLAVVTGARRPPVRQHHKGPDRAALREDLKWKPGHYDPSSLQGVRL